MSLISSLMSIIKYLIYSGVGVYLYHHTGSIDVKLIEDNLKINKHFQCLLQGKGAKRDPNPDTHEKLKEFNARRKLKGSMLTVWALQDLKRSVQQKADSNPPVRQLLG